MKCLHPIAIKKITGTYAAILPCGKCPECLKHKGNELTVRVVREFEEVKDFYFVTFTYSDENLPICETTFNVDAETGEVSEKNSSRIIRRGNKLREKFFRNAEYDIVRTDNGKMVKRYRPFYEFYNNGYHCLYHSVDTTDFQKFIKRIRRRYPKCEFKYLCVPEYGGTTFRPHFHCLFFGLPEKIVRESCAIWQKENGYTDIRKISLHGQNVVQDATKVAKYVSTYTFKGDYDLPYIKDGVCKKPRRCTSISFGLGSDESFKELSDFLKCADIYGDYDQDDEDFLKTHPTLPDDILARRYYKINGFTYPLPSYIKDKIFFKDEYRKTEKGKEEKHRVATALQKLVTTALFKHISGDIAAEQVQGEWYCKISGKSAHEFQDMYVDSQKNKEETSVKNFINKLKNDKV